MTLIKVPRDIVSEWNKNGFLIFRNVFSIEDMQSGAADSDRVYEEHKKLISTQNIRCRWQDNVFTGECQFDAFDPIIDLSDVIKKLAYDQRLIELLEAIYEESAFLFKDKLIYKFPGAKGYGLHQDWIAWERFPRSFLSVLVPLDVSDKDNGCTVVYPGYHHQGPLTPPDGTYRELCSSLVNEGKAVYLELNPGDIAVFGGFVPHRSNPNLSNRPRRQIYFSYTKKSEGGDLREKHYEDFHAWLKVKYTEHGKSDTYFA